MVLVVLVALAAGSFQGHEEPSAQVRSPSMTWAPSTTADRREFGPLAGLPLQRTGLRLPVASDPRPFVVDLDQDRVQPVTGLPTNGERVVSVLPVGQHAVIVSDRVCTSCRPPGPEVYGIWRGSTSAVRLGSSQEVVAAREGRAVWLPGHQTATSCMLREVGLDGRLRRPAGRSHARPSSGSSQPGCWSPAGPPRILETGLPAWSITGATASGSGSRPPTCSPPPASWC